MTDANYVPRFNALRNSIYHTARKEFYDRLNRILNFLVIILGAGVAGKAFHLFHIDELWLEMGVLVCASLQLTFDFGYKARTHELLQRKYGETLAEIELDTAGEDVAKWNAKLQTIASDEPMPMRALDALAYNAAIDSIISDEAKRNDSRLRVPILHRLLKNVVSRSGYAYQPQKDAISFWRRVADNLIM
jgi:hypothetical protein